MGDARASIGPNLHIVLFDEVGGLCPKCSKPLMKENNGKKLKLYELAHIYPFSPRPEEMLLLKDEKRLNDDVDHEDNFIALCRDCHKIFDTPRTVDGYREMYNLKLMLQQNARIKNRYFNFQIEDDIKEIIDKMASIIPESSSQLSFDAMRIDEKLDDNVTIQFRMKIKSYVNYFYNDIKVLFQQIDKIKPGTSDLIYAEVKVHYLKLKKDGVDQHVIFDALTEWIRTYAKQNNRDAAETLVAFFVQNCEVYS
ncbi:ABC-three component system protein [Yersinia enterocolitica]|uniref:ABC-three component system protein n=1 Tax=Yersinia enterocolitica TaxID=630 RepID=UPI0005E570A0|nr:ABC-three component system protein [Yersinia enterocolitica]ELX2300595.1 HNH endonuclease [Yersinia enterocolitica]CNL00458.1 Uncharacterised protein [Yersinia enterocolitica]